MDILFVGIDVSQDFLDVATCSPSSKPRFLGKFRNHPEEFEDLISAVRKRAQKAGCSEFWLVLEPTGGYEQKLALWAHQKGYRLSLPNPHDVRLWAEANNYRSKSDPTDAKMLTHYGQATELKLWHPMPKEYRELESMLNWRVTLEKDLRRYRNRRHALIARGEETSSWYEDIEQTINYLEEKRKKNEARISMFLKEHPEIKELVRRLKKNPGVGDKLVLHLLSTCKKWECLTNGEGSPKGLTALVGLDPRHFQSGSSVYKRSKISKKGSRQFRSLLYSAAAGAIRAKRSPAKAYYNRLKGKGKPHNVCLVAVARKILVWGWAVFRSGEEFNPAKAYSRADLSSQAQAQIQAQVMAESRSQAEQSIETMSIPSPQGKQKSVEGRALLSEVSVMNQA